MILPLFHLGVVIINGYALYYDQNYLELTFTQAVVDQKLAFKNRLLYLTTWCLILQTVYFKISFLNDIFGTNERSPRKTNLIRVIKDSVFSLALPIALFVFLVFWGIYTIDRDLIFPDHIRKMFPVWLNHVMHTTIVPFIFLELILSPRNYPKRTVGIFFIVIFTGCYLSYIYMAFLRVGTWVYPVLDVLPWPHRLVFFGLCLVCSTTMYILGEYLNEFLSPRTTGKLKGR